MTDPLGPVEFDDIDSLVPPKIMRLTQHMHNLIYIRYFYETLGQQPPEWTKLEMERAQKVLLSQLDREHAQGGAFRKEDPCDSKDEPTDPATQVGRRSPNQRLGIRRV
jgi:hypothetical protein